MRWDRWTVHLLASPRRNECVFVSNMPECTDAPGPKSTGAGEPSATLAILMSIK